MESELASHSNWWSGGRRGDPAWERHHLDELVPLVEDRLRIRRGRRWHAVHGMSMGGFGALFYASQRPGYFGTVAASSPVTSLYDHFFWPRFPPFQPVWGDPGAQAFYWKGHDPQYLVDALEHTRVYISYADAVPEPSDFENNNALGVQYVAYEYAERQYAQRLLDRLRELGNEETTFRVVRGQHTANMHRRALIDAMGWGHFAEVADRPRSWTFATVATTGTMWDLRFEFADPPDTLVTFRRDRDILRGSAEDPGADETVTITTSSGRTFTERLPFERALPDE